MNSNNHLRLINAIEDMMEEEYDKYCHLGFSGIYGSTWDNIMSTAKYYSDIDELKEELHIIEKKDRLDFEGHKAARILNENTWKELYSLIDKYK